MPKADLHLHLDGSLRPGTILRLAEELGVAIPARNEAEVRRVLTPPSHPPSLDAYLQAFGVTCSVMQTEEALERIALELVEDCALENIRYFEVRYSPVFLTERGLSHEDAIRAVARGLERGRQAHGVVSRQIICAMRHLDVSVSESLAETAVAMRSEGVVGFDLAGGEADHPARNHRSAFDIARQGRLRITVHAGEAAGPWSIADAVALLGAERIGHGTSLIEDGALLDHLADLGTVIEACPTSNVQTGAVRSLRDHPALRLQDEGLPIVICTDNRGVSDTTLTEEFSALMAHHEVSLARLRRLVDDSFRAAFLPRTERDVLRDAALSAFDALTEEILGTV